MAGGQPGAPLVKIVTDLEPLTIHYLPSPHECINRLLSFLWKGRLADGRGRGLDQRRLLRLILLTAGN